jgi:DNA-binding PadR family transcriptional regulator
MAEDPGPGEQPLPAHVFQIMLSLLGNERHGYALIQDVAARTDGEMQLGTSTLYAVLKRLERMGWATEVPSPAESTDGRRKYYALTPEGRTAVREEARRIRRLERLLRDPELAAALERSSAESGS